MNAILSALMALVMIFNLGGGMMSGLEEPVSIEAAATLNLESLAAVIPGMEEGSQQAQILKLVADVLSNVAFRGTADKQAVEFAVTAGEDTVASVGVRKAEDGITLASSLLEGMALNLSAETVQGLEGQMADQMGPMNEMFEAAKSLDQEVLMKGLLDSMDHAVDAVKEKAGEPETGDYWIYDSYAFTTRAAVEMDAKELSAVVLNAAKEYVSLEEFQKVFGMMGESANPIQAIENAMENLESQSEDNLPETTVFLYSNEEGESYVAAEMKKKAEENEPVATANIGFGTENKFHRVNVFYEPEEGTPSFVAMNLLDASTCDVAANINAGDGQELFINLLKNEERPMDGVIGMRTMGMFIRAIIDSETADGQTKLHNRILLTQEGENVEEAPDLELGTVDVCWGKGGAITTVFDGEGIKTLAVEPMLQGDSSDSGMTEVMGGFMGGAMKALSTLVAHLPEESGAMLNGLLQGVTAAPAE